MRRLLWLLLFVSTSAFAAPDRPDNDPASATVDAELVIAVDVSNGMDGGRLGLRREAYAQAITSEEFLKALKAGIHGRVAITYFEWSASNYQKTVVPWRVIDGPEAAAIVSTEILKAPAVLQSPTSISAAIYFGISLFDKSSYRSRKRVMDISGEGPNNSGRPVSEARDAALAGGITLNGLPLMATEQSRSRAESEHLDHYYEDCVTGGPGSLVVAVRDRGNLKDAIRAMLIHDILDHASESANSSPRVQGLRISCSIGEDAYRQAWGQPAGHVASLRGITTTYSTEQVRQYLVRTKECLHRHAGGLKNFIELTVKISANGMIDGDPQPKNQSDGEEFKQDVRTALKQLHACQPYLVRPPAQNLTWFREDFTFQPE